MEYKSSNITSDRLLLRKVEEYDLENIYNGLSHPEVIKHYGVNFDSLEATKEQMKWFVEPEQVWWTIYSIDSKVFYGAVGFNDISHKNKKAEIGLWLLPKFWGKGIMKEVMPLICNYGFDHIGLHRIEGFVESENKNCQKAMSKLNFRKEGTMIDCEVKNGKFISIDIYARFKRIRAKN